MGCIRKPRMTEEQAKEAYRLEAGGMMCWQVCEVMGVDRKTLRNAYAYYGIDIPASRGRECFLTKEQTERAAMLESRGWSRLKIALTVLYCDERTIRRAYKRYNIPVNCPKKSKKTK